MVSGLRARQPGVTAHADAEGFFFRRPALFQALALGTLLAAGCASPGPPRAPSLRLPESVTDLAAARVGDAVTLTWSTPAQTTDGDPIRGAITARICREAMMAKADGSKAVLCQTVLRQPVVPGPSHAQIALGSAALAGRPALEVYRIELENAVGRSAGPSEEAYAAGGSGPAALTDLRAVARSEGALLTWAPAASPDSAADRVQVKRTENAPAAAAATKPAGPGKTAKPPGTHASDTVATLESAPAAGGDPGGMIDRSVRDPRAASQSYTYVAQRVRTVILEGHAVEMRGLPSAPIAFVYKDTFAPSAPTGLVALPARSGLSVDLSWEANPETDLEGYNIYRRQGGKPFVRLNSALVAVPAFRDEHVTAGVRYTWRVTAVRAGGVESVRGAEASEEITR